MKPAEIRDFLQSNVEPLEDKIRGNRYRAAARLNDGLYLPCVVFQSKRRRVELALRRFDELRTKNEQYTRVVESFVASGSSIAYYEIGSVEPSPFAWPVSLLRTIRGETVMGWTAFVVEMADGSMHSYGTSFSFEFFDLPQGYSYSDILKIHSGAVYSQLLGLRPFSLDLSKQISPHREKPSFTCYLEEL